MNKIISRCVRSRRSSSRRHRHGVAVAGSLALLGEKRRRAVVAVVQLPAVPVL